MDLDPRLRALLNQHVSPDEQILVCCEVSELGSYLEATVLTDRRLVSAQVVSKAMRVLNLIEKLTLQPGGENERSATILLRDVTSIETGRHPRGLVLDLPYYVAASGRGSNKIMFSFPATSPLYEKVSRLLREYVDRARQPIDHQEIDAESRLRQLAKLYSDGLLTDEEYWRKRAEFIDRL